MLDLDVSLFFISLLIWVLMIILDKIYYKPVGKILGQRENKIEKDSALIESMIADVENKTKNIDDVLKKARTDSMKLRENLIRKNEEKIERLISEENENLKRRFEESMKKLDEEIASAEEKLGKEVEEFSNEIKEKFL